MPSKTTSKKKTVRKSAKKADKEMEFADGKVEDAHKISTGIEEILAVRGHNPFGTTNYDNFEESVAEMNLSQMQEMAVKASIFPSGNKSTLKNKLKREFKHKFGGGSLKFSSQTEAPVIDPDSKIAKDIMDILNS